MAVGKESQLIDSLWDEGDVVDGAAGVDGYSPYAQMTNNGAVVLVPMSPSRARASSLVRWNNSMSRTEVLTRAVAWVGARSGLLNPLLRNRIQIRTETAAGEQPTLHDYLAQHLGVAAVEIAVAWGPPRPNQKPVLRVFDPRGETIGFAKLGETELTRSLVDTEAKFLSSAPRLETMRVPELIHHGEWRNRSLILTGSELGRPSWRGPVPPGINVLEELSAISNRFRTTLRESPYRHSISPPQDLSDTVLRSALDAVDDRWSDRELLFGHWHGDWTPWNMNRDGDHLVVWDWERTAPAVPVGFDAIHYGFHSAIARGTASPKALVDTSLSLVPVLRRLGVEPKEIAAVTVLYAIEMSTRFAAAKPAPKWLDGLLPTAVSYFLGQS